MTAIAITPQHRLAAAVIVTRLRTESALAEEAGASPSGMTVAMISSFTAPVCAAEVLVSNS